MKLEEWKRKELNRLLMEKFNINKKINEQEELEEEHDCASHPDQSHKEWMEEQETNK